MEEVIAPVTFKFPVNVSVVFNRKEPETLAAVGKALISVTLEAIALALLVTPEDTSCIFVTLVAILVILVAILADSEELVGDKVSNTA